MILQCFKSIIVPTRYAYSYNREFFTTTTPHRDPCPPNIKIVSAPEQQTPDVPLHHSSTNVTIAPLMAKQENASLSLMSPHRYPFHFYFPTPKALLSDMRRVRREMSREAAPTFTHTHTSRPVLPHSPTR